MFCLSVKKRLAATCVALTLSQYKWESNNSGMWSSLSREWSHIFCNYTFKCTVFGLWTWLDYGGLFLARPWKEIRFIYWMGWWFRKFTFVISYIYLHDFSVHWLWNSASWLCCNQKYLQTSIINIINFAVAIWIIAIPIVACWALFTCLLYMH